MKLYYVHDPMCSWCWAFRPIYEQLKNQLADDIELVRLLGGLAPDSDDPMPESTRNYVIGQWQKIQQSIPHIQFNYDFWTHCQPRRSTYPACRAVIAARQQGDQFDELMTHAIQHAYYLEARNPSDTETLTELAEQIGCYLPLFIENLHSDQTQMILQQEISLLKQLNINNFPSLLVSNEHQHYRIQPDYHNVEEILLSINKVTI